MADMEASIATLTAELATLRKRKADEEAAAPTPAAIQELSERVANALRCGRERQEKLSATSIPSITRVIGEELADNPRADTLLIDCKTKDQDVKKGLEGVLCAHGLQARTTYGFNIRIDDVQAWLAKGAKKK